MNTQVVLKLLNVLNHQSYDKQYIYLAYYFLNHYGEIQSMTINKICEDNYISKSTLERFMKKLGYPNFSTFRQEIVDAPFETYQPVELNNIMKGIHDILRLDPTSLQTMALKMKKDKILFVIPSEFFNAFRDFQFKMFQLGKLILISTDLKEYDEDTEIFVFSYKKAFLPKKEYHLIACLNPIEGAFIYLPLDAHPTTLFFQLSVWLDMIITAYLQNK